MKNRTLLPRWIAAILSLIAIVGMFLPYIDFTDDYTEYLESLGAKQMFEAVDYTAHDLADGLSLYDYCVIYGKGWDEVFHSKDSGIFYTVVFAMPGALAALTLLCALRNRPTLMGLFSMMMGGMQYLINWDVVDRGIMPSYNAVWGVVHVYFYPCAAALFLCALWLFVAKHRMKKLRRRKTIEA